MKWYYVLFLIFVLFISLLSIYKALTPQNYNSNGVSFDYPGTWTELTLNQSKTVMRGVNLMLWPLAIPTVLKIL